VLALALFGVLCILGAEAYPLTWTVLGDWGNPIRFAKEIAQRSVQQNSSFVAAIGDNFYLRGVQSINDPKWKTIFENIYTEPFFFNRWYVIGGNHDYKGNMSAQLDYSKVSKRWYFPSLYYKETFRLNATATVDLIFLDTSPLYYFGQGFHGDPKQIAWLTKTLTESKAQWIIVFGHHEIYSLQMSPKLLNRRILHILENHKVAAYICGHHHSVQHLVSPQMSFIVTGNVGAHDVVDHTTIPGSNVVPKFYWPTAAESKICFPKGRCRGFTIMRLVDPNTLTVSFYDHFNTHQYTGTISNPRRRH
jgi:acid phosphatase